MTEKQSHATEIDHDRSQNAVVNIQSSTGTNIFRTSYQYFIFGVLSILTLYHLKGGLIRKSVLYSAF
jgi:hypothetical protein